MNQKRLWLAASIIAVVIVGSFALSVPHTRDILVPAPETKIVPVPLVSIHDSFKKGVHAITGSVVASNACSIITAHASLSGDATSTRNIHIAISQPTDAGVCLQVPTRVPFSTSINAPAGLPVTVTVNGIIATTTDS